MAGNTHISLALSCFEKHKGGDFEICLITVTAKTIIFWCINGLAMTQNAFKLNFDAN